MGGHAGGGAYYNQAIGLSISAFVEKDASPFAVQLASELTLSNAAVMDHMPAPQAGFGMTILEGIKRGRAVEDFESFDMEAMYQPYYEQPV